MGYDEDNDCTKTFAECEDPACPEHSMAPPKPTTALRKWADEAMFLAEPQESAVDTGVLPEVKLLWMTPDPLGAIASMTAMYTGRVVRDLSELSDDDRRSAFADATATHLTTPLEAVKLQFLLEGVDRSFTQQLERQRIASYAEQSLRFAVVEDLMNATTLPPSLHGTLNAEPGEEDLRDQEEQNRRVWDETLMAIQVGYEFLVHNGMPAEEARGLLPLCTATRVVYNTDLKSLVHHAGNRLCTQAQFHWRVVFSQIVQQIRNYEPNHNPEYPEEANAWQFHHLAESELFRPVCYQLGHCPWNASFDRACSIKDRVEQFATHGVPSTEWGEGIGRPNYHESGVETIRPEEWLLNPAAARVPYGSR